MAVTQNTYTGNGSTVLFSFTFPYLETTDIKVSVNGANTTAYTLANATTIQFNTAPANGAAIRIYRETDDSSLQATFYPGSAIRSSDLNDNFTQNLYVTQEANNVSTAATTTANTALTNANTAISTANGAVTTANTASSNASAAVATANTASSNASAAVSTANTANTNSTAAVNTANTASTSASTALSTANQALSTANTASTNASAAVNTANSASSVATSATSTANTAASNAASAVSTANAANTAAGNAVTTANSAKTDATAAVAASSTASTNASAAVTTANTASTNASAAVSTANTAASNASTALSTANTALSTANTASTSASNAVTTANSASTAASNAVTTANTANSKADQAIAVVGNSVLYTLVSNVAAIPASPANQAAVEVYDSTGIQSFSPLSGRPAGFVGSSGLSVRIVYSSAGSTWNWVQYFPNDPETRYLKLSGGTLTGNITLAGAPSSNLHPATKAYVDGYVSSINGDIASLGSTKLDSSTAASTYQTQSGMSSYLTTANAASTYQTQSGMSSYAPLASPTFTGTVTIPAGASISGYLTSATAASTYQTQAGMSSYLTTTAAGTTYAPLASPTFTGTPTGPSFSVTGSTVPANGLYLPSANTIGIATNSNGRAFIDSSGRFLVGTSTSRPTVNSGNSQVQIHDQGSSRNLDLVGTANSPYGPEMLFIKARSGTNIVQNGDVLGEIKFIGYDGTADRFAGKIALEVDGTPGANDMPGRLVFSTTADGASSPTERLRISNTGAIGLSGANFGTSGQVLTSQGSGAAPQWASAGSMILLGSVTASNSASVAFTSGINSTYDVYLITGVDIVPATNSVNLNARISTNGGSTYLTSGYDWVTDNTGYMGGYGSAQIQVNGNNTLSNTSSIGAGLTMYLYKPSGDKYKHMSSTLSSASGLTPFMVDQYCGNTTTTAFNAIQFYMSSGNISSGTFRLYGIRNS